MIRYVKNNWESPRNQMEDSRAGGSTLRMSSNNKNRLSGSAESVSSASSEESFINKVKGQWGDEESELRQAIYF